MKINELMTYISMQQTKCNEAYSQLLRTTTVTKVKDALSGTEEIMTPYTADDFDLAFEAYSKANENLKRAKVALINANNSTLIYVDMYTIQTAIAAVKALRNEVDTYQRVLGKQEHKERRCEGNGASYYMITQCNYNKEHVQEKIDTLNAQITEIENAITHANATIDVEVAFIA